MLSDVVGRFKTMTLNNYIIDNPKNWDIDENNPNN